MSFLSSSIVHAPFFNPSPIQHSLFGIFLVISRTNVRAYKKRKSEFRNTVVLNVGYRDYEYDYYIFWSKGLSFFPFLIKIITTTIDQIKLKNITKKEEKKKRSKIYGSHLYTYDLPLHIDYSSVSLMHSWQYTFKST